MTSEEDTEYSSHKDYIGWVEADANEREAGLLELLNSAFKKHITQEPIPVIDFSSIETDELAGIIESEPAFLKPLTALCNVAGRALKRDLGLGVDTLKPKYKPGEAKKIAEYIAPFLGAKYPVPTIATVDRIQFIDKEIRAHKGRWEKGILESLNKASTRVFKKRKFTVDTDSFEIDAASPISGKILVAVDVKRIEAKQDIHKRCDEIVNKAAKFKVDHKGSHFAAIVYYPFSADHESVINRLKFDNIDTVLFAGESLDSVEAAVRSLVAELK